MGKDTKLTIVFFLIILSLIYYIPGLISPRDFWVEDEARYAEVLREMIYDNQWIVPHLNGTFYPDKPPIFFWMSALISIIFGQITPFTFMIITWMSAVGVIVINLYFAKDLFNIHSALISSLLLMASFLMISCAKIVRMDMLLTFFVLISYYCFCFGYHKKEKKYYVLFYLFAGLAVLTKGPFGFILPFLPAIIFLMTRKEWSDLKQVIFNWGFILLFAIIGGWLTAAWLSGEKEFVRNLFVQQIAGRAVNAFSHKEPFYFYLLLLPVVILPWLAFFPRALIRIFKTDRSESLQLLFWYFTINFIVISAVSGKLFIYLLPLMPPLMIILGVYFNETVFRKTEKKVNLKFEGIFSAIFTFGLFSILPFIIQDFPVVKNLNIMPLTYIFLPIFIITIVLSILHRTKLVLLTLFLGIWILSIYGFLVIAPKLNDAFSGRQIGHEIVQFEKEGYDISTFKVRRGIFNFYAERLIAEITKEDIQKLINQPNQLLITKRNVYKKHLTEHHEQLKIISEHNIANEHYLIIANRKDDDN